MVYSYRPVWTTSSGGTGYSIFHARNAVSGEAREAAFIAGVRAFFQSVASRLPTDVTITFPAEVLQLDTATGVLTGVSAVTPPASVTGTGVGVYAAPTGGRVDWITAGIVGGRRVRGRTFLVPLISGSYDTDGSLVAAAVTQLQGAGDAYMTAADAGMWTPVVYSRPVESSETVSARAGTDHLITGAAAVDKAAILRGRRD